MSGTDRRAGLEVVVHFANAADGVAVAAAVHVDREENHSHVDDGAVEVAGGKHRLRS